MSALLKPVPQYRRMELADLDAVMAIENVIYTHPWTRGNFSDSLLEGYHCWAVELDGRLIGYTAAANCLPSSSGWRATTVPAKFFSKCDRRTRRAVRYMPARSSGKSAAGAVIIRTRANRKTPW